MESIFLVTAVVGAVELLRRLFAKDWLASATIVVCALIGAIAGWQNVEGLADVWQGITVALSASGLVTIASRIGPS